MRGEQKKRAPTRLRRCPSCVYGPAVFRLLPDWPDRYGLGAFVSLGQLELDPGTLSQGTEPINLNLTLVDKNIATIIRLDEPIPFGFVEPLYCAFWHNKYLYLNCAAPPNGAV